MLRTGFVGALLAAMIACGARTTAQEAGQTGMDATDISPNNREQLRRAFLEPPFAYRPMIILHSWPLTEPQALDWLAGRRGGGAVIDAGATPGSQDIRGEEWNNPTYLNDPEQFKRLRQVVDALHEQGRTIWLYDELGYPSASAGGRVLDGHREYQVEVVGCRTLHAKEGQTLDVAPEHGMIAACYALPERGGRLALEEAEDLSVQARKGPFEWTAPAGEWVVCVHERWQPDTWKRHNIPRRNVNILNRDAVARFIELTHERYAKELGPKLAYVDAFFTDEPQFGSAETWTYGLPECVPMIQWCDELPDAFRRKKGYDVHGVLPALFHNIGPMTSKYRYDFYDVQSDLAAENYFGQIQSWCRAHGLASSGHMLLEESLLFHVMFSGSMMKNWARMDLPGVDLLGTPLYHTMGGWNHNIVPVEEDFSCKMASSVSHLLGKEGTFTESYAVAQNATLRQALGIAAWQFSGGVTHMSTYTIQEQLSAEDYAAFSDFVGRLALLCRRGDPVADVAVLVPEASVWASYTPASGGMFPRYFEPNREPQRIDQVFRDTCHELLQRQRDFECLGEDMLARADIRSDRLALAAEQFAFLVLPEMRMLSRASLDKVRAFLNAGGRVAFVGGLPSQDPEKGDDPALSQEVCALLDGRPEQTLHVTDLKDLPQLVDWMNRLVPPRVEWEGPGSIRLLERHESGRTILLLANPGKADAEGRVAVTTSGGASVWNPETGAVELLGEIDEGGAAPLGVPAESARFLVIETATDQ
jgi:hypothetical protein